MKIKNIKRLTTLSASILSITASYAYAAPAPGPTPAQQEAQMVQELKTLNTNVKIVGNRIQASAEAAVKSKYSLTSDGNAISQSETANIAYAQNKDANMQNTFDATQDDIQNQLQPLSDNALETGSGMEDSDAISKRLGNELMEKQNLTFTLPGSDSLYSNDPAVYQLVNSSNSTSFPAWGLKKPVPMDNFFNFGSIIQPTAYEPGTKQQISAGLTQEQAAQSTVNFLTQSYNNPGSGLTGTEGALTEFQAKLTKATSAKDKLSLYMQLVNDPEYINYILSARAATAQRSVSVNNFQHLISERTPVKDLGKKAGIPGITNASPLQVQAYLATHRVSSPQWYSSVQSASSASVQRQTLVVLAEIEAQNYQAHLDRERILATLSAQSAASSTMAQNAAMSAAKNLASDVKNNINLPTDNTKNDSSNNK